jgi:hypothetical protein
MALVASAGEAGSRSTRPTALFSGGGELSIPVGAPARAPSFDVCVDIARYLDVRQW